MREEEARTGDRQRGEKGMLMNAAKRLGKVGIGSK